MATPRCTSCSNNVAKNDAVFAVNMFVDNAPSVQQKDRSLRRGPFDVRSIIVCIKFNGASCPQLDASSSTETARIAWTIMLSCLGPTDGVLMPIAELHKLDKTAEGPIDRTLSPLVSGMRLVCSFW
ncbi:hypothetical protein V6N13_106373 [Hibiscus sabdariffa]|uniref:Uncharacterized protein n=1 Tax=Hibiscus sabdariffa TaxID=183260 RepID=A0ABR2F0H2_9ROSI